MAVKRRSFKKNTRSGLKKKSRIYRKKSFSKKSRKNNKKSKKSKLRKRNRSRRFNKMIGGASPTNSDGTYILKDETGVEDNIAIDKDGDMRNLLIIKKNESFTVTGNIISKGTEIRTFDKSCPGSGLSSQPINITAPCIYSHRTNSEDKKHIDDEIKVLLPNEKPGNDPTSLKDFIDLYCNKEVKLKDLKQNEHILIDNDKIKKLQLTKIEYTDEDKNKSIIPFANDESTLKITKTDCCYTLENPINLASKIQNITPSPNHILACTIYDQDIEMTLKELIDIFEDIILGPSTKAKKTGNFKSNVEFTITEPESEPDSYVKIEKETTIQLMRNSNDIFTLTNKNSEFHDNIKHDAKIFKIKDEEDKLSLIELRIKHLKPVPTKSN
jgi:hypothetical protein